MNTNEQMVYDILNYLEIEYKKYEHKPVFTCEEAKELEINVTGQHCKNLFLRNRKGDVHYLVILDEKKKVDLKDLSKQIGSTNLSFASGDRLFKYLQLKPGSVTPFGLINDAEREVMVLIDKNIVNKSPINFHPNVNSATLGISYSDFEKFIKWHGNKFQYIEIK